MKLLKIELQHTKLLKTELKYTTLLKIELQYTKLLKTELKYTTLLKIELHYMKLLKIELHSDLCTICLLQALLKLKESSSFCSLWTWVVSGNGLIYCKPNFEPGPAGPGLGSFQPPTNDA